MISIWGRQMRRALLLYFGHHGVSNPDPGTVACLTAIGVTEIDRQNLGFKSTSFLGMASLLVPAILDPNHRLHGEITAAVQACKGQLGAVAMVAETVKQGSAAKLPLLGKRAKAHARILTTKTVPNRVKATPKKPRPK